MVSRDLFLIHLNKKLLGSHSYCFLFASSVCGMWKYYYFFICFFFEKNEYYDFFIIRVYPYVIKTLHLHLLILVLFISTFPQSAKTSTIASIGNNTSSCNRYVKNTATKESSIIIVNKPNQTQQI